MLEEYLLDHRWLVAVLALTFAAASVGLAMVGQRMWRRQDHFQFTEQAPLGVGDRLSRTTAGQAFATLTFATVFVAVAFTLDRQGFGVIAGGLLVGYAVSLAFAAVNLLNIRRVGSAGTIVGQVRYSADYRYSLGANQFLVASLVVWLMFALRGGPMLFGGGVFLLVLALGYHRRARQARRRAAQG